MGPPTSWTATSAAAVTLSLHPLTNFLSTFSFLAQEIVKNYQHFQFFTSKCVHFFIYKVKNHLKFDYNDEISSKLSFQAKICRFFGFSSQS